MNPTDPILHKDELPAITFNGLAGPKRSWSCGNTRLISDAGSYLERLTSLCGPSDQVAELVKIVVDATEKRVKEMVDAGEEAPNLGIGWWQGETWDLLIYMEVSGSEPALALADILNSNLDLLNGGFVLRGVDHPMFGCSDTFWSLLEIGHNRPEKSADVFDLARLLCTTYQIRGETPEDDDEHDGLRAPNPSDVFQLSRDVYAFLDSFAAWDVARKLDRSTGANASAEGEPRRI
jgi:hypothetical protein